MKVKVYYVDGNTFEREFLSEVSGRDYIKSFLATEGKAHRFEKQKRNIYLAGEQDESVITETFYPLKRIEKIELIRSE